MLPGADSHGAPHCLPRPRVPSRSSRQLHRRAEAPGGPSQSLPAAGLTLPQGLRRLLRGHLSWVYCGLPLCPVAAGRGGPGSRSLSVAGGRPERMPGSIASPSPDGPRPASGGGSACAPPRRPERRRRPRGTWRRVTGGEGAQGSAGSLRGRPPRRRHGEWHRLSSSRRPGAGSPLRPASSPALPAAHPRSGGGGRGAAGARLPGLPLPPPPAPPHRAGGGGETKADKRDKARVSPPG